MQGMEQASPDRGQWLRSRLAMLSARASAGTVSSELCTNLNSPPERMCVRSKKHRIQLREKNNNKNISLGQEPCFSFPNPAFPKW